MASKLVANVWAGMACPYSASFGYLHGPGAGVANLQMIGDVSPPVGTPGWFAIGPQTFYGFVTNRAYNAKEDISTLRLVDWRDRLHDVNLFFQINMQEQDGRFYHILPDDWELQRRTWVTPELPQWPYPVPAGSPGGTSSAFSQYIEQASGYLMTTWLLLQGLADVFNFTLHWESMADSAFVLTTPLNLDGNGGMSVAQLIDLCITKSGLQWTVIGKKEIYISLRGYSEYAFVNALVNSADPCLSGADEMELGEDLNENGRRVKILGEHNKYERVYLCRPNWNPKFTWTLAFGQIELSALLGAKGLTLESKLSEMPPEYHDPQPWPEAPRANQGFVVARPSRNSMTIQQYIDKFVYKCYKVDFESTVTSATLGVKDVWTGTWDEMDDLFFGTPNNFPLETYRSKFPDWKTDTSSIYPPSSSLVSESNLQLQVYATSHKIVRGAEHPFPDQLTLIPKGEGIAMEVEDFPSIPATIPSGDPDIPDRQVGMRYSTNVRVFFGEPQFYIDPQLATPEPNATPYLNPDAIAPDLVAVSLSLNKELYTWTQGEPEGNLRVRERVVQMKSLHKNFINDREVEIMAQNLFDLPNDESGLRMPTIHAGQVDAMAQRIAQQLLFHLAITRSGSASFKDMCGMKPDGIIQTVLTKFHPKDGISEEVSYTNENHRDLEFAVPITLRVSYKLNTEEKLIRDRNIAIGVAAYKNLKIAQRAMSLIGQALQEVGIYFGIIAPTTIAKEGAASVSVPKSVAEGVAIPAASLIPLKKPTP